jgi:transposase
MLADQADHVIGVDTHRDTHTAALIATRTGELGPHSTTSADAAGYRRLLSFADQNAPGRRVWAIEGTGAYGAGLCAFLRQRGERIVEVDRPKRPARRSRAKSDELDAINAAREVLARQHPTAPRGRGEREAVRVLLRTRAGAVKARTQALCQLMALRVCAPEELRAKLRRLRSAQLVARCARLRVGAQQADEERMTRIASHAPR